MRVVIVGCGGIGFHVAEAVARILNDPENRADIIFVDGDTIESKNIERQFYPDSVGKNKATALCETVKQRFTDVSYTIVEEYVNRKTLTTHRREWLHPKNGPLIVLVCVDNHASRVFLEKECAKLPDVAMIFGGNDEWAGQAQLYLRRKRKDVTPKLTEIAPEILDNDGFIPEADHCLEESTSEPQTALVNRAVSVAMETMLVNEILSGKEPGVNEILVDTKQGSSAAFLRPSLVTPRR